MRLLHFQGSEGGPQKMEKRHAAGLPLLPHGRDSRGAGACDGVSVLLLGILQCVGVCSTRRAPSTSHVQGKWGLIRHTVGAASHRPLTTCEGLEVTWSLRRWHRNDGTGLPSRPWGRRRESGCVPSLPWKWSLMVCPPSPWTSVSHITVLPVHVRSPPRSDT